MGQHQGFGCKSFDSSGQVSGVCPIGIGETLQCVIGKGVCYSAVMIWNFSMLYVMNVYVTI